MVKLSERMKAVAAMVTSGGILADIGTDHGYVPIALMQEHKIKGAIAMDINQGPLARAKENIEAAINVEKFKDADYKKILQLIEALKEMV